MAIERVCVVGGGVIGSLYAGHLARVAEVSVLTRRDEHARALDDEGLRISGKSDFTAAVYATADPGELPDVDLGILATKATQLEDAAARARRPVPRRDADDDPERPRRRGARPQHGDWPLISAVTFMSGVRHDDAHVEYELDTETWLGPFAGTATYEQAQEIEALLVARGPPRARLPRPAAGAVVEADLQRDREHRRRPDRPPARGAFAARDDETDLGNLVHDLMDEGKAVAAAAGVELHEDPWEMNVHAVRRGETLAAEGHYAHVPSMLEDVRAGRRPRSTSSPARSSARRRGTVFPCRCTRRCTGS